MKKFALFHKICYNSEQLYETRGMCHKVKGENFMKKKIFVGALIGLATIPMSVNAAARSTIKFEGQTNVNVGDEFKVNMVIDNVAETEGGVVGFGGYISYDKSVLQLVGTEQGNSYEVLRNENNNKIIGIDYTLANGIYERTNVYTITFKAIGEGDTSVTLYNGEVADKNDEIDLDVEGLYINSKNVIETPVETTENTYVEEQKIEKIEQNETTESVDKEIVETKDEKVTVKTKKAGKKAKKVSKKNGIMKFIANIFNKIFKL